MGDPVASSILLKMADVIEQTPPPSWRKVPGFKRRRSLGKEGGASEALPEPKDPRRTRLFDLFFESSADDPSMASDEERWCFQGVILVRLYYADIGAVAGELEGFTGSRMQVDDMIVLHRALIQQQKIKASLSGVSVQHNTNAVYTPGQTDWRVTVRWEEQV